MKKYIPAFTLALLSLSACGSLKSERKPLDQSRWALTTATSLSPQEFQSTCLAKPGMMLANNTICRFEAYRNVLAEGSGQISESADYALTTIPAGAAVETVGNAYNGSVEVIVNGGKIAGVPTTTAVISNGGTLSYRVKPGQIYGVKVFVYSCVNQSQQAVRCPQ
jgi:hypothetical protein